MRIMILTTTIIIFTVKISSVKKTKISNPVLPPTVIPGFVSRASEGEERL